MKNVEKHKHEIAQLLNKKCVGRKCESCSMNKLCRQIGASVSNVEKWLFEEYEERIKLTQFEYDLIHAMVHTGGGRYEFKYSVCNTMKKEKGYFKGIEDTNMALANILSNCVVKDDG